MEEVVLFPFKKIRVKPSTVLIETVLSGDPLYLNSAFSSSKIKVTLKKIVIDLKIVPTRSFGTCHVIEFLKCNRCRNIVITLLYKQGLKLMDVPKSFNIYFTPRNSWQGIVTNYRTLPEPYKVDTFASGLV